MICSVGWLEGNRFVEHAGTVDKSCSFRCTVSQKELRCKDEEDEKGWTRIRRRKKARG